MNTPAQADRKPIRTVVLAVAFSLGSLAGLAGGGPATADVLISRADTGGPGGGSGAASAGPEWAQTQNERSIALIESKEAPGGVLAGGPADLPDWAQSQNQRSIALIESKEAPGGVLAGMPPEDQGVASLPPQATLPNQVAF